MILIKAKVPQLKDFSFECQVKPQNLCTQLHDYAQKHVSLKSTIYKPKWNNQQLNDQSIPKNTESIEIIIECVNIQDLKLRSQFMNLKSVERQNICNPLDQIKEIILQTNSLPSLYQLQLKLNDIEITDNVMFSREYQSNQQLDLYLVSQFILVNEENKQSITIDTLSKVKDLYKMAIASLKLQDNVEYILKYQEKDLNQEDNIFSYQIPYNSFIHVIPKINSIISTNSIQQQDVYKFYITFQKTSKKFEFQNNCPIHQLLRYTKTAFNIDQKNYIKLFYKNKELDYNKSLYLNEIMNDSELILKEIKYMKIVYLINIKNSIKIQKQYPQDTILSEIVEKEFQKNEFERANIICYLDKNKKKQLTKQEFLREISDEDSINIFFEKSEGQKINVILKNNQYNKKFKKNKIIKNSDLIKNVIEEFLWEIEENNENLKNFNRKQFEQQDYSVWLKQQIENNEEELIQSNQSKEKQKNQSTGMFKEIMNLEKNLEDENITNNSVLYCYIYRCKFTIQYGDKSEIFESNIKQTVLDLSYEAMNKFKIDNSDIELNQDNKILDYNKILETIPQNKIIVAKIVERKNPPLDQTVQFRKIKINFKNHQTALIHTVSISYETEPLQNSFFEKKLEGNYFYKQSQNQLFQISNLDNTAKNLNLIEGDYIIYSMNQIQGQNIKQLPYQMNQTIVVQLKGTEIPDNRFPISYTIKQLKVDFGLNRCDFYLDNTNQLLNDDQILSDLTQKSKVVFQVKQKGQVQQKQDVLQEKIQEKYEKQEKQEKYEKQEQSEEKYEKLEQMDEKSEMIDEKQEKIEEKYESNLKKQENLQNKNEQSYMINKEEQQQQQSQQQQSKKEIRKNISQSDEINSEYHNNEKQNTISSYYLNQKKGIKISIIDDQQSKQYNYHCEPNQTLQQLLDKKGHNNQKLYHNGKEINLNLTIQNIQEQKINSLILKK